MSTTSKRNTLFDISCPDPVLQIQIFEQLLELDLPQLQVVYNNYRKPTTNKFLLFAEGYYQILMTVNEIGNLTNSIYLSNGILSDFFIHLEDVDSIFRNSDATNAYRSLKNKILDSINIVHIHVRNKPGNDGRRMALSIFQQTVEKDGKREQWIVFETPDIDAIAKKIVQCMSTLCEPSE